MGETINASKVTETGGPTDTQSQFIKQIVSDRNPFCTQPETSFIGGA